jgi:hypothetical protein
MFPLVMVNNGFLNLNIILLVDLKKELPITALCKAILYREFCYERGTKDIQDSGAVCIHFLPKVATKNINLGPFTVTQVIFDL